MTPRDVPGQNRQPDGHRYPPDLQGESSAQPAAAQSIPAPITVVIVDDHLMVADGLATVLSANEDMTVLAIAGTRASGLEAVGRCCPDVLLLDQRLPDGLGTDSLEAMLALCPRMKVLMVTAGDVDDVLARAIMAGASGVILKGKRAVNLINAVRAVAHNEAVITPDALRRLMPHLAHTGHEVGSDLTAREREVLTKLVAGKSTSALAAELFVAPATARNHIQSIMSKLGAHSRLEAVAVAMRENVLSNS